MYTLISVFGFHLIVQGRLQSQDYGKHLLDVEDMLQKHSLLEADITIQAEPVKTVCAAASKFSENGEGLWFDILMCRTFYSLF